MIKKLFKLVATAFFIVAISSCASTSLKNDVATISKYDDAMFWEINGVDKEGKASKLYVLGTIHIGDDRLYPLPKVITDAFVNSDKLVSELSSEDWDNMIPQTVALQMKSAQSEAARIAATGKTFLDDFSPEEIKFIETSFGSPEMVKAMAAFEPWVLSTTLSIIPIQLTKFADPSKGIDNVLLAEAKSMGKHVEGLDTLETQFNVITFGDRETQIMMIHDVLKEYMEDLQGCVQEFKDLYEFYIAADESKLTKLLVTDEQEAMAEYSEEYFKVLISDRNEAWADTFANYLAEGGTTFIFAGAAHFLGDDSVFEIMKKNKTLK